VTENVVKRRRPPVPLATEILHFPPKILLPRPYGDEHIQGKKRELQLEQWARERSRYSDWLWAGQPRVRIPMGGEIFRTCPDRPWDPPSLLYNGYRIFPRGKEWPGRDADPSPPSSAVGHERVELHIYYPYGPLGACTRVHFTFFFLQLEQHCTNDC